MENSLYSSCNTPYSDLYIYYFKGHLAPNTDLSAENFIGNWEEDEFSFLFYSRPSRNKIHSLLTRQSQLTLLDEYHMAYTDWLGETPAPFQVGSLVVAPPWDADKPFVQGVDENRLILLDPGVVFGTGSHPTTRDCLAAIELVFSGAAPQTVLDLGAGTGLLSLAAAKLGSKLTLAVDINLLAAVTTNKNVRLNRIKNRILTVQGKAEDFIDRPADLLIANLHYDVMKHLISTESFLQKKWFVLSGLLRSQARDVAFQLAQKPVCILRHWEHNGIWHTFLGERQVQ